MQVIPTQSMAWDFISLKVMLKLNPEALVILHSFQGIQPRSQWSKEKMHKHRLIKGAYGRLIEIVLYVNQDAISLDLLSQDDLEELRSAISRIQESRYWATMALGKEKPDPTHENLNWLLLNETANEGCGVLAEAYKLISARLLKYCHHSLVLENALVRLMNSYHLAGGVCDRSIKAVKREQDKITQEFPESLLAPITQSADELTAKKKRRPRPFKILRSGKSAINRVIKATKMS